MKKIIRIVVLLLSGAGVAWFLAPIHWNVWNIGNQFGFAVSFLVFLAALFYPKIHQLCRRSRAARIVWNTARILFAAGVVWSGVLTALMFSAATARPPETATVVVLGSKVSGTAPSADLRVRIETAAAYLKEHPKAVCIACGAQGRGEAVSEAVAIRDGLAERGIGSARVLLDDRSYSTKQNFENALKIIRDRSLSADLAVVTDDYHEFRACSIARKLGVSPYAVPAQTPSYIYSACWARELLAITAYLIVP